MRKPLTAFLCYAQEDCLLYQKLRMHLKALEGRGLIKTWAECDVSPGTERAREIETYLNMAHIILLLLSVDFMNSDHCLGIEMEQAMRRHECREARVIPILLRSTDWKWAPFGILQPLPRDEIPLNKLLDLDTALTHIVHEIRGVAQGLAADISTQEGVYFSIQGHYDEALQAYDQALILEPNSTLTYHMKGVLLCELKRYEEALEAYDQAIRLDSNNTTIYKLKGDALYELKRYDKALESYERSIYLKSDDSDAYDGASRALYRLSDECRRKAEEYHKKVNALRSSTEDDERGRVS